MGLLTLVNNLVKKTAKLFNKDCHRNRDEIHLKLDGLDIYMERCFAYDQPHEVSVFVPRAELRKKIYCNGEIVEEIEILLNSITVVHSPQRPSNDGHDSFPELPEIPRSNLKYNLTK